VTRPLPVESPPAVRVDVLLRPEERRAALLEDARAGLTASPKRLPPKWFYDERGSELFERITRLPEYYLTGAEREILTERAAEIASVTGADTLVELGSGTSRKTRILLDALRGAGSLARFAPFDSSEATLREAAKAIAREYAELQVHAVGGDFERHLDRLPRDGRRLVAFLGSTIGNLPPGERARFLTRLAGGLVPGDAFLLGTDLVKDPARLEAAYGDSAGVTAEFNRNVLLVLNRELGADFDLDCFEHVARWDPGEEWIELLLRSTSRQTVAVRDLELEVEFGKGEEMQTEISAKFRREGVQAELAAAGLELVRWWTDAAGDFALSLSRPASPDGAVA
jgi:L-histidine N-alpha-methyltransferase